MWIQSKRCMWHDKNIQSKTILAHIHEKSCYESGTFFLISYKLLCFHLGSAFLLYFSSSKLLSSVLSSFIKYKLYIGRYRIMPSKVYINRSHCSPRQIEKSSLNFYFNTFLWYLRRFYEDPKDLHKTFCGITKKCENKNSS